MSGIEQVIDGVERLYRTVTGQSVPDVDEPYAPIPAERNPEEYVAQQVDRLTAMLGSAPALPNPQPARVPPMSVWETEQDVILCVELPGVAREGLHVQSIGRTIQVFGQRGRPSEPGSRLTLSESGLAPFHRVIGLPPQARVEDVSAKIGDGLLELRVPKLKPVAEPSRKVPVL